MSSDYSKSNIKRIEKIGKIEASLEKFGDLLENLDNIDHKLKSLWIEIYANAVKDRDHAMILWTDLLKSVKGNPQSHGIYGPTMAKYLERMSRSNDQILKLAEMIEKSTNQSAESISEDDVYNQIGTE